MTTYNNAMVIDATKGLITELGLNLTRIERDWPAIKARVIDILNHTDEVAGRSADKWGRLVVLANSNIEKMSLLIAQRVLEM